MPPADPQIEFWLRGADMSRWAKAVEDLGRYTIPAPPPDGGYIVLSPAQISDWDLVCMFRLVYPNTKLIAQQPMPMMNERVNRCGSSTSR